MMDWWGGSLALLLLITPSSRSSDVRELRGIGDYREIAVSWESPRPARYMVHYCEQQAWGPARCKHKPVAGDEGREKNGRVEYQATLDGLRMSTNYSVTVEAGSRGSRRLAKARSIVIQTKGFSAKAVSCLPEASEVEIETGPYFQGRIGVESGGPCAIDGDPNSPRTTYYLRIRHQECGSQVNDTAASTFILVQESTHILTHSTRRFLVLCTFQPETLTVRAGLNLPQTADGMVEAEIHDISANDVHAAPLKQESRSQGDAESGLGSVLGAVVALLGVVAIGVAIWKRLPQRFFGGEDGTRTLTSNHTSSEILHERNNEAGGNDPRKEEDESRNYQPHTLIG